MPPQIGCNSSGRPRSRQALARAAVVFLLVVITTAAYGQLAGCGFVNFDDDVHVYDNEHVRTGLTLRNTIWAFGIHGPSQWHPLSWLSHQLDCTLFGLKPACHHLVNLALHIGSVAILFVVLERMTGALWPSAVVAALFAVHPLNVESVAWVSERRNVLSGLFWMLTLWAYVVYAERGGMGRYLLVVVVFALGLMAKPMLVTLPCVLLLLDYWPLHRWRMVNVPQTEAAARGLQRPRETRERSVRFLLLEKIPLLVLSAASSMLTFWCQQSERVVVGLERIPILLRLANAIVSYATYLRKMVWPSDLGVFYPHPAIVAPAPYGELLVPTIVSTVLLLAITWCVFRAVRNHPYLVVGWLWFLGALAPMIGVVQVGEQQMADRYGYVSLIGIFVAIAWGLDEVIAMRGRRALWRNRALFSLLAVVPLAILTRIQVGCWRDSVALFEHTAQVTNRNYVAHNNWGLALHELGRRFEAVQHYQVAINFLPGYALAHYNLGVVLHELGQYGPAEYHLQQALRSDPGLAVAHMRLGGLCGDRQRFEEAAAHFLQALEIAPRYAPAYLNLGIVLDRQGRRQEAAKNFRNAITITPDYVKAHYRLARCLLDLDELAEAQTHFQRVIELSPASSAAHNGLGVCFLRLGNREMAVKYFQEGLRLDPNSIEIRNNLHQALNDNTR